MGVNRRLDRCGVRKLSVSCSNSDEEKAERFVHANRAYLKIQLQCELYFTWIGRSIENFPKRTQRGRSEAAVRVCEIRVVEGIEELASELDSPRLAYRELFEDTQVDVLNTGS